MTDTVPAAFFAQWVALQGRVDDLTNEKVTLVEEKSALREERITLQNKYDNLKKEHDELVEEHRDYAEEMTSINTRLKQELEEALAEKEESKRQMHVTREMCDFRLCLTENCYNCMAGQFDLIKVFKYYKENTISVYSIREILNSDHRETLNLPKRWKSSVEDANVREFFETIVAALPNLKSITGYPEGLAHCYVMYTQGNVPRQVLEAFCGGYNETTYYLTQDAIKAIQSAALTLSDYLSTVIPLLTKVTDLSLPDSLNASIGDDNVGEFLEMIVAALPNLKSITGYFTSLEHCYIQHKEGIVPRKVLEAYCGNYGKTTYELTNNTILAIESSELTVSGYLITVIPLLPEVIYVSVGETKIATLDWCAALPDSIIRIDISDCPNLKDCTPLLKMKGLKVVFYNSKTNPSFNAVKEQLKSKGVTCKPLHPY
ncbi:hypothetical protein ADEAN_000191700 [Angomonas deanei]|uniref:Uncharacterized protein n=1 Tax=Angomonas deanei TaxID=59799 RepID=A0A7G2C439_9TRYP|nr:hypothetical protein ADEAN_000191700 [Angomonas deanei]